MLMHRKFVHELSFFSSLKSINPKIREQAINYFIFQDSDTKEKVINYLLLDHIDSKVREEAIDYFLTHHKDLCTIEFVLPPLLRNLKTPDTFEHSDHTIRKLGWGELPEVINAYYDVVNMYFNNYKNNNLFLKDKERNVLFLSRFIQQIKDLDSEVKHKTCELLLYFLSSRSYHNDARQVLHNLKAYDRIVETDLLNLYHENDQIRYYAARHLLPHYDLLPDYYNLSRKASIHEFPHITQALIRNLNFENGYKGNYAIYHGTKWALSSFRLICSHELWKYSKNQDSFVDLIETFLKKIILCGEIKPYWRKEAMDEYFSIGFGPRYIGSFIKNSSDKLTEFFKELENDPNDEISLYAQVIQIRIIKGKQRVGEEKLTREEEMQEVLNSNNVRFHY